MSQKKKLDVLFPELGKLRRLCPDSRSQRTAYLDSPLWMEATLQSPQIFYLFFFPKTSRVTRGGGGKHLQKACQYLVLDLHRNLPRLLPSAAPFLLQFIFFFSETPDAYMKAARWPLRPPRFERSEKVRKEMCTWKPPKFRRGESSLWSKDASISSELQLCHELTSAGELL